MSKNRYLIKREMTKEFDTGGEVTVAVTYNINHPEEIHRAPEWVKEIAAKGQLGIMEQRLISASEAPILTLSLHIEPTIKVSVIETDALHCLAQHLATFHRQAVDGKKADFAEPCAECCKVGNCRLDWLEKLGPICSEMGVAINLGRQGREERRDTAQSDLD